MKRALHALAALVVAAALPLAPIGAQAVSFHIGGGGAFGTGDLADGTDTGWIGFAGLDYPIMSMPGFAVGATASYTHIPYSGVDAATNIPAVFGEVGYLIGAASPSRIKPYVRAGVGVMQHRYSADGGYGSDGDSETKLGGAVGAGLNFVMTSVTPFIGAHFITGGSDTSFIVAYVGLSFGGRPSSNPMRR
jgi:opacity protein-like surface antigen